jgi:hypothetical protein
MPIEEKRRVRRARVLKGAKIVFKEGASIMDCTVRNISDTGACLNVASPIGIPAKFELILDDGRPRRTCRLAWQSTDRVGVVFE